MKKIVKTSVVAALALTFGILTSCKDNNTNNDEMNDGTTEMEVTTEEELTTTATDTSLQRTESNQPGVTSGEMEQVP